MQERKLRSAVLTVLMCGLLICGFMAAQAYAVTADGNLSDIRALPQAVEHVDSAGGVNGVQDEPILGSQIPGQTVPQTLFDPTGFNIGSVVLAYDKAADAYYIGLDVSCLASDDNFKGTPSVAWDADGDGFADTIDGPGGANPEGSLFIGPVSVDNPASILDAEQYLVGVDIGNNGSIDFVLNLQDDGAGPTLTPVAGLAITNSTTGGQDVEFTVSGLSSKFPTIPACDFSTVRLIAFADTQADSAEERYNELFELPRTVRICKTDAAGNPVADFTFSYTIAGGASQTVTTGGDGCVEVLVPAGSSIEVCETLPQGGFNTLLSASVNGVVQVAGPQGPGTYCVTAAADGCPNVVFQNANADFSITKGCQVGAVNPDGSYPVTWTVEVCNTGDVALDITVNDAVAGIVNHVESNVAPGECRSVTATQNEPCGTGVTNTAIATAVYAGTAISVNGEKSDTSSCTTPACPGFSVAKGCEVGASTDGGQTYPVTWTINVCNTGGTPLDLVVNDPVAGIIGHLESNVQPGECRPVTATQSVACGTTISNEVTVTAYFAGTPTPLPTGNPQSATSTCTTPPCPDFSIAKACVVGDSTDGGLTYPVTFTITVCNTSPVGGPALDITVNDPTLGIVNQVESNVAPGECRDIVVTQSVPCGTSVTNTATATATAGGVAVDGEKSATSTCETPACQGGATRTPGYWFTHPTALLAAFDCAKVTWGDGSVIQFCDSTCTATANDAMAIFWRTSGSNTPTLAQQVLSAMFNQCLLGTPAPAGIIQAGLDALCSGDPAAISAAIGALDAFNNSGDDVAFPNGTGYGPANTKQAKTMANAGTVSPCAAGPNIKASVKVN